MEDFFVSFHIFGIYAMNFYLIFSEQCSTFLSFNVENHLKIMHAFLYLRICMYFVNPYQNYFVFKSSASGMDILRCLSRRFFFTSLSNSRTKSKTILVIADMCSILSRFFLLWRWHFCVHIPCTK